MKKDKSRSVFPKKKATSGATPKKGPGRPRLAGESTYMRLDSATLDRVAKRREQLQANAVADLSQSDVLRSLIGDGLDLAEGKHALAVVERTLSAAARQAEVALNQAESFLEWQRNQKTLLERVSKAALALRGAIHEASAVAIAMRGAQ